MDVHLHEDRQVALGDATDSDFWERADPADSGVELVMLTPPDLKASLFAIRQMKARGYPERAPLPFLT